MYPSPLRRSFLSSLTLVISLLAIPSQLVTPLSAQPAPVGAGDQMLATKQYLFVVHEGVLHQFDIRTLKLRKTVKLTSKKELLRAEAAAAKVRAEATAVEKQKVDKIKATLNPKSPAETGKVVERALTWLIHHQDKDGKWDCDGFMRHDSASGEVCDGPGNPVHDVGVTGLAIMALATAGDDYKKQIRRAVSWLHKQQNANGLFGSNASHDFVYDHAIACLAVCRACQTLDRKDAFMLPMAQKAINYLETHRNPYSVWRYQPRDNDNDTSISTWCLLSYAAAKDLGLKVNKNAIKLGESFFNQVTNQHGHVGYTKVGEGSSRRPGDHGTRFPIEKTEVMTALGLYCRYELKQTPTKKPIMDLSAKLLMKKPPVWDPKGGTVDEYYWLFGSLAMQRVGGDDWAEWSKFLTSAVADHQCQKGNRAGSWDPIGVWAEDGGRVYTTAALALACHATLPPTN